MLIGRLAIFFLKETLEVARNNGVKWLGRQKLAYENLVLLLA